MLTSASHSRTTAILMLSAETLKAHMNATADLVTKEMALVVSVSATVLNFFFFIEGLICTVGIADASCALRKSLNSCEW